MGPGLRDRGWRAGTSRVEGSQLAGLEGPPLVLKASKSVTMFQRDTSWTMEYQKSTKA